MPLILPYQPGADPVVDRQFNAEGVVPGPVVTANGGLFGFDGANLVDIVIVNAEAAAGASRTIQFFDDIGGGTTTTSPLSPVLVIPPNSTFVFRCPVPLGLDCRAAAASWTNLSVQGRRLP